MRKLLTWVFLAILVVISNLLVPVAAYADTECAQTSSDTGECILWVEVPGTSGNPRTSGDKGPKGSGTGTGCFWDGTAQGISSPPPGPVPCSGPEGYWSNHYRCYIKALSPPPPAGDPAWEGHTPGDGGTYSCHQPQTGLLITVWAQDPPPNSGAAPTPREVALIAIERMRLSAIDIGIAPEPGPDSVGLVGMPVWMWAKAPDEHTVGPLTETASAGGVTITATANVLQVTWDMGDGTTVACEAPGSPYKASYGLKESPDCGHTYTRSSANEADDAYTVTATSSWVITWSGAGQTGTIRLNGLVRSTQIQIGEAQVLVN